MVCDRAIVSAADLYTDPKDLRPWVEERVRVAKWYEHVAALRATAGAGTNREVMTARYTRLDAEIALYKLDRQPRTCLTLSPSIFGQDRLVTNELLSSDH